MPEVLEQRRTLTQSDFDRFAALSGDHNPIHVDESFSAGTRFGRTVSHGVLLCTVLRGLMDQLLPGCRLLSQSVMYPAPAFADEELVFRIQLLDRSDAESRLQLEVLGAEDGLHRCRGEAVIGRPEFDA